MLITNIYSFEHCFGYSFSETDSILVYVALGLAIGAYIFLALLAIYVAVLQRRIQRLQDEANAPPDADTLANPYVIPTETKIPLEDHQNSVNNRNRLS